MTTQISSRMLDDAWRLVEEGRVEPIVPRVLYRVQGDTGVYMTSLAEPDALMRANQAAATRGHEPALTELYACTCPARGACKHAVACSLVKHQTPNPRTRP